MVSELPEQVMGETAEYSRSWIEGDFSSALTPEGHPTQTSPTRDAQIPLLDFNCAAPEVLRGGARAVIVTAA